MKSKKIIALLVVLIALLSLTICLIGLFSNGGEGTYEFTSINNQKVIIHGEGIYKNDSKELVAQGKAQDLVTLVMAIPLLLISLVFAYKGSFKGKLLLTGTLGYFLYTYVSYVFLVTYNSFFLIYVTLMSLSLFSFVLLMMSYDIGNIVCMFKEKLPRRFLGGYQIFIAVSILIMWLSRILKEPVPTGLEHYTTLVIEAMDLAFIVPTAFLSGILLIKKKPYGYLLSSVIIIKGITLLTAICAMAINQVLEGIGINIVEVSVFFLLTIFTTVTLVLLLKNVNSTKRQSKKAVKA